MKGKEAAKAARDRAAAAEASLELHRSASADREQELRDALQACKQELSQLQGRFISTASDQASALSEQRVGEMQDLLDTSTAARKELERKNRDLEDSNGRLFGMFTAYVAKQERIPTGAAVEVIMSWGIGSHVSVSDAIAGSPPPVVALRNSRKYGTSMKHMEKIIDNSSYLMAEYTESTPGTGLRAAQDKVDRYRAALTDPSLEQ